MEKNLISIGNTAKLLGVSIDTLRRWDKSGRLKSIRSGIKGHRYYCKTRVIFQARLDSFESKLSHIAPLTTVSLITAVAGEIGNNSFDHNLGNWPDIPGIFFAYSMRNRIIALADRGLGVLTTLKRVRPSLTNSEDALKVAFTETLSGRYPESRGNGLKFVRFVITDNPFTLDFQTGDAHLYLKEDERNLNAEKLSEEIKGCFVIIGFESLI